ncbi:MAG: hypothetical protein ABJH08_06695, partial [Balneola sp.]
MKLYKKLIVISCTLIPSFAMALKPSEILYYEGLLPIFNGVPQNHLTVTEEGISGIVIDDEALVFSSEAILEIQTANANVDYYEAEINSAHCYSEAIGGPDGCSQRLVSLKNKIISILSTTTSPDATLARNELGRALHTLQDFYAHSNWVNDLSKQDTLYSALTNAQPYLPLQDEYEGTADIQSNKTCEWDTDAAGNEQPFQTLALGKRGLSTITTGWIGGDPLLYKCEHGEGDGNGLNKDTPAQTYHDEAVRLATLHTKAYTTDILTEVLNSTILTPTQRKQNVNKFLGVLGTTNIGFVIDTTGSMSSVIEGVKSAMQSTVVRLDTENKDITNFHLISYGDPGIGDVLTATDSVGMLNNINSVQLNVPDNGGDDPEKTMDALLKILGTAVENSFLYVYTDASTKNGGLASAVIKLANEKNITISFFLTMSYDQPYYLISQATQGFMIKYEHSPEGAEGTFEFIAPLFDDNISKQLNVAGKLVSVDVPVTSEALLVKAQTSAKVYPEYIPQKSMSNDAASSSNTEPVIEPIDEEPIYTSKIEAASTEYTSYFEQKFYVDDTTTKVIIDIDLYSSASYIITRPDGTQVLATDEGVNELTIVSFIPYFIITDVMVGEWSIELLGRYEEEYEIDISVVSDIRVVDFGFKEFKGHPEHQSLFPINGNPTNVSEQLVSFSILGNVSDVSMAIHSEDGSFIKDTTLTQMASGDTSRYVGQMTLPDEPFIFIIEGKTASGERFTRTHDDIFTPEKVTVSPISDPLLTFSPDTEYDIGFTVSNLGEANNFLLEAELPDGTPITIVENEISLEQNETKEVRVVFTTPADLTGLSELNIILTASTVFIPTNAAAPTTTNYAIFTASIDHGDSDGDSVSDTTESLIYDGNSDGIVDSQQANVISLL